MSTQPSTTQTYEINPSTYDWSVRIFRTLKKLLSVHVKLYAEKNIIDNGEIFLFNHFARFETFIPQYLIYEETGHYCFSVAHREFFSGDEILANYLASVGAVPHDHKDLLPILTREVLKGRKIIIFPEGGMVKDRQVLDNRGNYSIFSRTLLTRRKHHTGAAVLALGIDAFKKIVAQAYEKRETKRLQDWSTELGIINIGSLLESALRPTVIIPANITFYPIRIKDNLLKKGAELLHSGITRRHSEELLIEGNILLKNTDMDIRFGSPIIADQVWNWPDRQLIKHVASTVSSVNQVFELHTNSATIGETLLAGRMTKKAGILRDQYMECMYQAVTVNLSHLASALIIALARNGQFEVSHAHFHLALYLAVKALQNIRSIHMHRGIINPDAYRDLPQGDNEGLRQFLSTAETSGLLELLEDHYHFLPKILETQDFDTVRLQNPVVVYFNETAPLPQIGEICESSLDQAIRINPTELAELEFDDEIRSWKWDKDYFSKPCFDDINRLETAIEDPCPFFLRPEKQSSSGVLLVHGLLASPAEVRSLGERLKEQGHMVMGVRLKGHGTSPRDLREQQWEDWYKSLQRAHSILRRYTESIHMVGFSTGGALALRLAAEQPESFTGVSVISVPIRFQDPKMMFIPLVHGTNTLVRWMSNYEGIKPFLLQSPEHPDVNYRHIPVRALYELRRLIIETEDCLCNVQCPVIVIQGDKDPVVDPKSAEIIFDQLGSSSKELLMIESERHGILMENTGQTQEKVSAFIQQCANPSQHGRTTENGVNRPTMAEKS